MCKYAELLLSQLKQEEGCKFWQTGFLKVTALLVVGKLSNYKQMAYFKKYKRHIFPIISYFSIIRKHNSGSSQYNVIFNG